MISLNELFIGLFFKEMLIFLQISRYRTSSFGQSDIVGYKPAPGDVAYPERLLMMKNIEAETTSTPKTPISMEASNKKSTSAIDLHCLW